jgi:putative copper export protein/ABC-type branched-subunit amino acid transport system substrate-binding protein
MSVSTAGLPEGIYTVKWVALGDDGHTVAGGFQFGAPGPKGQIPAGAGRLLATTSSNGSEQAPTESLVSIAARWVSALCAFVLLGGGLLLLALRGGFEPELFEDARRRWSRLALASLLIALLATAIEAIERSRAPLGGLRLSLLTASTAGVAVVVRFGVLALGAAALRLVPKPGRGIVLGASGALALAALAIDGHVATVRHTPALAAVGQVVHLLSAGAWMGGVLTLAVCVAPAALSSGRAGAVLAAARRFTPIALPAAVLTIGTGVVAAVREARSWYFLRWTTYGHVLIVKVGLVALVLALGATTTLIARRALAGRSERTRARGLGWLMRSEALLGVGVIAVAAGLAGTLQGRGQPLPSQRGSLLPGAGFADVAVPGSIAQLTLAPARVGLNRIVVDFAAPQGRSGSSPPRLPRAVSVALSCACGSRSVGLAVPMRPGRAGASAWYGDVELPLEGTWSAELKLDGQPAVGSPTFTVGVPHTAGSTPVTVASVADLSGPDAADCRSQELGALFSIELMNIVGGLDGRKITQLLLDDGGDPATARSEALALAADHPVAFLDPCGDGADAAIRAIGDRIPTLVADPGVPVTAGRRVFRFAPDPYSEGFASGQYIGRIGLPAVPKSTPRRVAALVEQTPDSQRRLLGLEQALLPYGVQVRTFAPDGPGLANRLRGLLPSTSSLGIYLDGPFGPLARALREVGAQTVSWPINPTAILTSSRLASERFIEASGLLGREGQIRPITDVDPTSAGAQAYVALAPQIVGELPTLPGLSGFVAGQALAYGLIAGTSPDAITARLREPGVFSRAATSPWSDRNPATGTLIFRVFLPIFLTNNLIPAGGGSPGEVAEGQFFSDGDWEPGAATVFTPLPINVGTPGPVVGGTPGYLRPTSKKP